MENYILPKTLFLSIFVIFSTSSFFLVIIFNSIFVSFRIFYSFSRRVCVKSD